MISNDSSMQSTRSRSGGHGSPSGLSFNASPDPIPRKIRRGNISSRVAQAWATSAGWYLCTGAVTPVPMHTRRVAWHAAPSHPRLARFSVLDPWMEVVARADTVEPDLLGEEDVLEQLIGSELLVGCPVVNAKIAYFRLPAP